MSRIYQGFCVICLFIFSGCVSTSQEKIKVNESKIKDNKPEIQSTATKVLKKINTKCINSIKIMNYSNAYINKEFKDGYFINKDLIGAKAQLFLIENRSHSVFAQNINKARDTYMFSYKILVEQKCDVKKFEKDPLIVVKNTIKNLEK